MATKPVKWFDNSMAGAPTLTGAAGSLIAVLDACLVNGFNLMTLDSLVVSGGVLIGTKAGHGFVVDQVIVTAGANEAPLNGEWAVTEVTTSTFKATATGISNVTGTGTITAKAAPAGWSKVYSGTNKAAYKSSSAEGTGCFLRVDDTGTLHARVIGYESMTDVDTGVGPFPTSAQVSGGGYWCKGQNTTTARRWFLAADNLLFYFQRNHFSSYNSFDAFGDYKSERPGDAYNCLLQVNTASSYITSYTFTQIGFYGFTASTGGSCMYSPRNYTQLGSSVQLTTAFLGVNNVRSGSSSGALDYPSQASNGLILSPIAIAEVSGPIRCMTMPGVYATPQKIPLANFDKITDVPGLTGRKLITLDNGNNDGRVYIDLTGPWR